MVLTNRWRDFCIYYFGYGIIMGVIVGVANKSAMIGLVAGAISGAIFACLMLLANFVSTKSFRSMRTAIGEKRRVICDGCAVIRGVHGWLFLTEKTLEFHPGKSKWFHEDLSIPTVVLQSADVNGKTLTIRAADTLHFNFTVAKSAAWKEQLDRALGYIEGKSTENNAA